MTAKTTILVLAANPFDTQRLRLDQEMRRIRAGLERAKQRDSFELVERQAVTPDDLRRAILDLEPRIVHFCGHGVGTRGLLLESSNGSGSGQEVRTEALAHLFELVADKVECLVLNSCYSEVQAVPISRCIRYVVGMRKQIQDQAAIKFAEGFYDALGAGRPIDQAFKWGRSAIELELADVPDHLWPVLRHNASVPPPDCRGSGGSDPLPTNYSVLGRMGRPELDALVRRYKAALAEDQEDSDAYHGLGLVYLQLKLYDLAQRSFQRSFELAPDAADAHYYYALALIRGRRPRSLGLPEVRTIESHLSAAIELDERRSKYYYLLAILRYDYYRGNGLGVPRPNDAELLDAAARREPDPWEVERLLGAVPVHEQALLARIRRA